MGQARSVNDSRECSQVVVVDKKETTRNEETIVASGTIFGDIAAPFKIEPCSCEMKRIDPEGPTPDFGASAKSKDDEAVGHGLPTLLGSVGRMPGSSSAVRVVGTYNSSSDNAICYLGLERARLSSSSHISRTASCS